MQQFETPEIKIRPDGSIDTAHYMTIGRQKRAEQAGILAKGVLPRREFSIWKFWAAGAVKTA